MGTDFHGTYFSKSRPESRKSDFIKKKCFNEMKNGTRNCYATTAVTEGWIISCALFSLGSTGHSSHQLKTGDNRRLQKGLKTVKSQIGSENLIIQIRT